MFKIRLWFIAFMMGVSALANAQFAFGMKGGALISNFYGMEMSDTHNTRYGFNVGMVADYNFQSDRSILTGFNLRNATVSTANMKYDEFYLQLPLYYSYKIYLDTYSRLVFRGGPFFAFGFITKRDDEGITKLKLGNNGAFDAGIGISSGVELNKLLIDIGADFGLTDMIYPRRSTTGYLTIGFLF